MSLERFLLRLPKVELHVHLEGSMRPAVLLELARRNGIELPAQDEAGLKRWFRFTDFEHFVQVYLACSRALRSPEDFQLLALDFLTEQAYQNVVYTEVHFTISTHLANGVNGDEVLAALAEAIAEGERRHGVTLRLIPDIVRNVGVEPADRTLDWALAGWKRGVVAALGLSGSERLYPNEPFRDHFTAAKGGAPPRGARRRARGSGVDPLGPRRLRRRAHRPRRAGGRGSDPGRGAAGGADPARGLSDLQRLPGGGSGPAEPRLRPALPVGRWRSPSIRTTRPSSTPISPSNTCACTRPSATPRPSWPASRWPPSGSPSCRRPSVRPGGELPPAVRRSGEGDVRRAGRAAGELG